MLRLTSGLKFNMTQLISDEVVTKQSIQLSLMLLEYPYRMGAGDIHLYMELESGSYYYPKEGVAIWVRNKTFVVFRSYHEIITHKLSEWRLIEKELIKYLDNAK
jgi:hypothetical protein